MTETLNQLRQEFSTPCPSLTNVREKYFSHITSDKYLLRKINAGQIKLKVTRMGNSSKGKPVVYLHDLANYLDAQTPKHAA